MSSYIPLPHEETFNVRPIGVRYKCEFCNEGEMVIDTDGVINIVNSPMIKHKCTKCGKTMLLPKTYPYIEWTPIDEDRLYEKDNDKPSNN